MDPTSSQRQSMPPLALSSLLLTDSRLSLSAALGITSMPHKRNAYRFVAIQCYSYYPVMTVIQITTMDATPNAKYKKIISASTAQKLPPAFAASMAPFKSKYSQAIKILIATESPSAIQSHLYYH